MKQFLAVLLTTLALVAHGQVAMMALDDISGEALVCVTNWGPYIVSADVAETALRVAGDLAGTNHVIAATNALSGAVDVKLEGYVGLEAYTIAISVLEGGTNDWNTAYGWGDHAAAGYVTASVTNGLATLAVLNSYTGTISTALQAEADATALAALATNRVTRLQTADGARWQDATGGVWEVTVIGSNLTVRLSDNFKETMGNTRPAWTTHAWPFTDGDWYGHEVSINQWRIGYFDYAAWEVISASFPCVLVVIAGDAQGTATLYYEDVLQTSRVDTVLYQSHGVNNLNGAATNFYTYGFLALPQSEPTNLVLRLVASNDVILAVGVHE